LATNTKSTFLINHAPIFLGAIGLILSIIGIPIQDIILKNVLFAIGAAFLSISSALAKEFFFASLEAITLTSAVLNLFNANKILETLVLVTLVLLTIILCTWKARKVTFQTIIGVLGLILLNTGVIFSNNYLMFLAGLSLSIYSYLSIRAGVMVGWIFLILNSVFTLVAVVNL
jgi:hypothetical protein